MTYEGAKVVKFHVPKKKDRELSIVPNPSYQVSKIDLVFKQRAIIQDRPCIRSSSDAYDVFMACWDQDKIDLCEEFKVMYLNRANYVLSIWDASKGGITGTVADPRHIILAALEQNATSMILAHNHPSGCLKPSRQDEELTTKINGGAKFMDLRVYDHEIITRNGYYSFADEGIMPC